MAVGIERFDNIWRNCTSARALQGAATETVALAKTPQGLRTAGRPSVSRTSHLAESPLRCTFPKTQLSDGGYPVKDLLCPSRVAAFFCPKHHDTTQFQIWPPGATFEGALEAVRRRSKGLRHHATASGSSVSCLPTNYNLELLPFRKSKWPSTGLKA